MRTWARTPRRARFCMPWRLERLGPHGHGRGRDAGREPLCQTKWLKAVPDAEDGLDVLFAVLPEFLPQAANVHIQGARANLIAVTPDTHEQNLAGDDFAGVLHQEGKQLVFFPRQDEAMRLSLIHISEPTRLLSISY